MARLSNTGVAGFPKKSDGEDWQEYYARQESSLQEFIRKSSEIPEGGDVKGAVVKFPVADGHAYYVVVKSSPLTVAHIPFGDSYEVAGAMIRGLNRADVERQLAADRAWSNTVRNNEDFYTSLKEGQAVHYNHGFGCWIRCEAVRGTDSQTGEEHMVLKPVALVGGWREYNLGIQVKKIRDGRTMRPHESHLWESPRCVVRARGAADPTVMDSIDISGPPENVRHLRPPVPSDG